MAMPPALRFWSHGLVDTRCPYLRSLLERERAFDVHVTASHRPFLRRLSIVEHEAYTHFLTCPRSTEKTPDV